MDKTDKKKNPISPAMILGILFLTLACLYSLFFIYPSYLTLGKTRQALLAQTAKLERLQLLYPIQARSRALSQIQFEHVLPFPGRVPIHRNELSKLSSKISVTAQHNHMTLSGSDFDINSLKNKSQSITMIVTLKGEIVHFRQFLIDIIEFEFFDSIEKLTLITGRDQMKNFTLNLNIRIKNNQP